MTKRAADYKMKCQMLLQVRELMTSSSGTCAAFCCRWPLGLLVAPLALPFVVIYFIILYPLARLLEACGCKNKYPRSLGPHVFVEGGQVVDKDSDNLFLHFIRKKRGEGDQEDEWTGKINATNTLIKKSQRAIG